MKELEIFKEVIQCFYQKKEIEDEVLFYILDNMSERFVESNDDSEWQCYDNILNLLKKIWQYKQFDELSSEQSYLYGAIWGGLSMLSSIKKKKETSQRCHTLAMKYKTDTAYTFLNAIFNRPGVQNKKLADLCDVSTARVSQIASEALKDGLISTQVFGKEKSYYIRTVGESVRDIINKQKEQLIDGTKSFSYKMIFFSNEEDDFLTKYKNLNPALDRFNKQYKIGIAVAIAYQQEEIQVRDINKIRNEGKSMLCRQEMNNLFKNFGNFWELPKEANMINHL